MSIGHLLTRQT